MKRVSVADIMRETGLSRATVDRALNGRGKVHPRTKEAIDRSLQKLGNPDAVAVKKIEADIMLRLGRGMMGHMRSAWDHAAVSGQFIDMYQADERTMLAALRPLCENAELPLIVTSKNTDAICEMLGEARRRGKRIITIISDVKPDARDFHVGFDDRAAGQTAAFVVGRALGDRPTNVAVLVGDSAFRCHEDREIGFRAGLRANFPKVVLSGEARGEDSLELTRQAVLRLLADQPALTAIYNVGGGNAGLAAALRDAGRADDLLVIGHEVNSVTTALLRDGSMDYAIAANPALMLDEALKLADGDISKVHRDSVMLDFGLYTRFNLPSFAQTQ